jgi:uncharacterized protein
VEFELDPQKDSANLAKHGVGFLEASSTFHDTLSLTRPDPDHSEGEYRYLTLGYTSAGRLVVVAHADRGNRVRIINARLATAAERRQYESG